MVALIRTKSSILYDSVNQRRAIAYLGIGPILFDGKKYIASTHYYTINDDGSFNYFKDGESVFTSSEADGMYSILNVGGTTFTQRFINLVAKSAIYNVGIQGILGLTENDWEIVT